MYMLLKLCMFAGLEYLSLPTPDACLSSQTERDTVGNQRIVALMCTHTWNIYKPLLRFLSLVVQTYAGPLLLPLTT